MGKIPNLTNMFQLGWFNHQLVKVEGYFYSSNLECLHDLKWRFKIASKHGNQEQVEHPQIIKPKPVIYTSYILILYVKSLMMCLYMCIYAFRLLDGERFPWEDGDQIFHPKGSVSKYTATLKPPAFLLLRPMSTDLGGGSKYFLCSPLLGEMIQFDEHTFQRGWFNHQPGCISNHFSPSKKEIPLNPPKKQNAPRRPPIFSNPTKKHGLGPKKARPFFESSSAR